MKRVSYYYDTRIGSFHYAQGHPMRPIRVKMTHSLIVNYGLSRHMTMLRPEKATYKNLVDFHSRDYINFLQTVCKDNAKELIMDLQKFNVGDDCPVFQGLYDYCSITSGGSLSAALRLNNRESDVAINWAGGLHHAKRSEASGFCYVNDIVLAILELLKYNERILYVDIDVHHGDGVEEAFYTTDRVMTVSFHKYGEYFPGTGDLEDTGLLKGKHYAVNVPLKDGITDETYQSVFVPVISRVFESYRPSAVVLQCGADSLSGDRLGCFNLSHIGHSSCIKFVKSFGVPLMVLGGGGYTIRNVSRAWAYGTSVLLDVDIPDELPYNEFYHHYGPEYKVSVPVSQMKNLNSPKYLRGLLEAIFENLRFIPHAPSVQMMKIPPSWVDEESDDEALWDENTQQGGVPPHNISLDDKAKI